MWVALVAFGFLAVIAALAIAGLTGIGVYDSRDTRFSRRTGLRPSSWTRANLPR
jgi:hypothetical protein